MSRQRIALALCAVLLVALFWTGSTEARQQVGWSEPYRLSSEATKASEASLVADQYGYLHIFWTETQFQNQRTILQYTRFDGETWSMPNDIYVTGRGIENLSPVVDQHGTLHLVWTESSSGPVYYTYAQAYNSLSSQNWASPRRIEIPAGLVQLRVDSKGVLHVLYVDRLLELGVYYVRSEDQGETWSKPVWLDPQIPADHTPQDLNFELDDTDGLHVVWNYGALGNDVPAAASVRYAHSLDGGVTWSLPFIVDQSGTGDNQNQGASGPRMVVQGQTVHVIWAAGEQPYRHHRFSTDAGQTWNLPRRIFGDLHGQAWDGLTVDGAGRIHFLGQIRYPMAIYHAYWDQNRWSNPSMVYLIAEEGSEEGMGDRVHAHFTVPAIRAGNQLVLTFTDPPADPNRRLFVMHRTLADIPPLETITIPTPTAVLIPPPSPTPRQLKPTATATAVLMNTAESQTLGGIPKADLALRFGLVPVLLLLGGTFIFRLWNKHRS